MEKIIIAAIILSVLAGVLPAFIASTKGLSFFKWWIYGALLFPIALPHSLLIGLASVLVRKRCGWCRTMVPASAEFCPKCGYEFETHGH
ncbi:MAG: zinc ribbon domain-containing protein [Deltaproteobacteria bacterium]|nr:zinc ribbon domain-containing protein [Deltaproteobacteria bacterium]